MNTLATIMKQTGKVNSVALKTMLVVCFAFPSTGFSQTRGTLWVSTQPNSSLAQSGTVSSEGLATQKAMNALAVLSALSSTNNKGGLPGGLLDVATLVSIIIISG